eukprot:TRINITY_DN45788_c0_g1_i1.p1 TRINITY_DN45788_c0_g1~~TRINITY_DN45788_c0_g1_i1.p1  ORF type:complete len:136 (-),score=23.55 TRINITY_DN45788_c0_g1_i1:71-478(-)
MLFQLASLLCFALQLSADETEEAIAHFCSCSSQGQVNWEDLPRSPSFKCWALHQKLPPDLFALASALYQNGASMSTEEGAFCPVGALNVVSILGLVWEAHDVGESKFAELLNPALDLWELHRPALQKHVISNNGS